jgi:hypothetical protein
MLSIANNRAFSTVVVPCDRARERAILFQITATPDGFPTLAHASAASVDRLDLVQGRRVLGA